MQHFLAVLYAIAVLALHVSAPLAGDTPDLRAPAAPRVQTAEAAQPRARGTGKQTGYDAAFVKMNDVPKKLRAGQVFYVEYTMKNKGNEGWGPDNEKHTVLRSREPDDNKTWGTFFITQGQGTAVPPGKEFTTFLTGRGCIDTYRVK